MKIESRAKEQLSKEDGLLGQESQWVSRDELFPLFDLFFQPLWNVERNLSGQFGEEQGSQWQFRWGRAYKKARAN